MGEGGGRREGMMSTQPGEEAGRFVTRISTMNLGLEAKALDSCGTLLLALDHTLGFRKPLPRYKHFAKWH